MLLGVLLACFGAVALYRPWVSRLTVPVALVVAIVALAIEHLVVASTINQLIVAVAALAAALSIPVRRMQPPRATTVH
jgi:hypothetical protein